MFADTHLLRDTILDFYFAFQFEDFCLNATGAGKTAFKDVKKRGGEGAAHFSAFFNEKLFFCRHSRMDIAAHSDTVGDHMGASVVASGIEDGIAIGLHFFTTDA